MTRPVAELRAPILRWYRRSRRDLPWRRTRDPYAIWVSEVMLQQTRVATVLPYYRRFMKQFPDPSSLARAPEEQVLAAWSGLGYYRRARSLRAAAKELVKRHGGHLPEDARALQRLPGIGRYTAGAIASIAFGQCEPVLDGNVRRVLARLFGTERGLWSIAAELADGPHPGDLNQALMELGALVCTPRGPSCATCPLARSCRALAEGDAEAYPAPRAARATETVRAAVGVVRRANRVLLERPGEMSPLRGTWDLPARPLACDGPAPPALRRAFCEEYGLEVATEEPSGRVTHGIMHRRISLEIVPCRLSRGRTSRLRMLRWAALSELEEVAISGATTKVLRRLSDG